MGRRVLYINNLLSRCERADLSVSRFRLHHLLWSNVTAFLCVSSENQVYTQPVFCFGLWSLVPTANSASALWSLLCRHFSLSKRVVVLFLIYNQNANFCRHSSCPLIAKLNRIYRSQLASPHTNKVFAHFGLPYLPNSRVPRVDMSWWPAVEVGGTSQSSVPPSGYSAGSQNRSRSPRWSSHAKPSKTSQILRLPIEVNNISVSPFINCTFLTEFLRVCPLN